MIVTEEQRSFVESVIRAHMMRDWPRCKVVAFCKHLIGDSCNDCPAPNRELATQQQQGDVDKKTSTPCEGCGKPVLLRDIHCNECLDLLTYLPHRRT